jgi:hypothetical protein
MSRLGLAPTLRIADRVPAPSLLTARTDDPMPIRADPAWTVPFPIRSM